MPYQTSSGRLCAVWVVKRQMMMQNLLTSVLHLHSCDNLKYSPPSGLEPKARPPVADPSNGIWKGGMESPFDVINVVERRIVSGEPH